MRQSAKFNLINRPGMVIEAATLEESGQKTGLPAGCHNPRRLTTEFRPQARKIDMLARTRNCGTCHSRGRE